MNNILWSKLIINSCINPVTAIFEKKNGFILEENDDAEKLRLLIQNILQESVNIAIKKGINLEYKYPFQKVLDVAKKTSNNSSSMLNDKLRKVETEIEFINGFIIKEGIFKLFTLGLKFGIPTPYNNYVYNLLK
jgi:2-dehydropantoate 2-reductase